MINHTRHASSQCGPGRVIYFMHSKMVFNKPPLSIPEQIHNLRQKGLLLDNEQEVIHYLTAIGYYRLMIYFKPFLLDFETGDRHFKPNTRFSDLLNLYVFDRELRLLVIDALERIEVSFRTGISNATNFAREYHSPTHYSINCGLSIHYS